MKRLAAALVAVLLLAGCSSAAPATLELPDVVGMQGDAARDTLEELGVDVEWYAGGQEMVDEAEWTVDSQDPAAGADVAEGDSVTLTVSKPDDAIEEPSETPDAAAEPLAATVEAELKSAWGVESFTDGLTGPDPELLNWYISSIEDGSPGIVNVTVQVGADSTTTDEVKLLSERIMNLTCGVIPDLEWVVVATADGALLEQTGRIQSALCS
jgi:hypothetical protein